MRVGLIACSKAKLAHPAPAAELYQGQLFKLARPWIESRTDTWAILSARHGVVMPDQVLEPYDLALASMPIEQRRDWCAMVHGQLLELFGEQAIYLVLAGAEYRVATNGLPFVEDVITHWTKLRKLRGMRRPAIGIGTLKRMLREGTGYY